MTHRRLWIGKVVESTFNRSYVIINASTNKKKISVLLGYDEMKKIYNYIERGKESGFLEKFEEVRGDE